MDLGGPGLEGGEKVQKVLVVPFPPEAELGKEYYVGVVAGVYGGPSGDTLNTCSVSVSHRTAGGLPPGLLTERCECGRRRPAGC